MQIENASQERDAFSLTNQPNVNVTPLCEVITPLLKST